MPDAPAAGGGGGAGVPPALAPCTPEKFDEFWEAVEALELQDVLQCIGDDLSGAGGCLTQAEWPVGGKANFLQQERLVAKMRSAGIHVADLPVDGSFKRKDRAWWKATGVPLLTRVRAKLRRRWDSYFRRAQACRTTPGEAGGHRGRQWGPPNIAAQVPQSAITPPCVPQPRQRLAENWLAAAWDSPPPRACMLPAEF
jgi:hypothetical protein